MWELRGGTVLPSPLTLCAFVCCLLPLLYYSPAGASSSSGFCCANNGMCGKNSHNNIFADYLTLSHSVRQAAQRARAEWTAHAGQRVIVLPYSRSLLTLLLPPLVSRVCAPV